ncbi:Outer membrane protein beta-barrel domain-containing protein [Flavobacterium fluvii]|uniref:Outer membrane protein beta-barrel domain-containing protein n=1 Tax=Flavobacterium fluvii TaxID=468056 RepID=A0A1M5M8P1_9FLAO|nr:porin family protein [Flavobacterium fluvii]SHG73622.1 Outer membrane protein beta-barrel domain-containing protein [Flavobacterium fluvii]
MKKVILMLAFVTVTVTNGNAQYTTDNRETLSFGLKLGANYSNVYDSDNEDFVADSKFGFAAGAFVAIPFGTFIGIQPEVLYSQKGFKSSGTYFGSSYEMTRTTDFIDVPLLFAVKPIEQVTVLFGPQFSYLLKQKDEFTGGNINSIQQQEFDNDDITKNIMGLTGGVDINVDKLVFGLRTGWDIKTNEGDGNSSTPRYKNMWHQLTMGYKF